jgi:hypothetical protein
MKGGTKTKIDMFSHVVVVKVSSLEQPRWFFLLLFFVLLLTNNGLRTIIASLLFRQSARQKVCKLSLMYESRINLLTFILHPRTESTKL